MNPSRILGPVRVNIGGIVYSGSRSRDTPRRIRGDAPRARINVNNAGKETRDGITRVQRNRRTTIAFHFRALNFPIEFGENLEKFRDGTAGKPMQAA